MKRKHSYITHDHRAASRCLGFALTTNEVEAWHDCTAVWRMRLTEQERAGLAWAALRGLAPDTAEHVALEALNCAGMPMPLLSPIVEEATFWASKAMPIEREAYCFAAYRSMAPARQLAFLNYIREARAA